LYNKFGNIRDQKILKNYSETVYPFSAVSSSWDVAILGFFGWVSMEAENFAQL